MSLICLPFFSSGVYSSQEMAFHILANLNLNLGQIHSVEVPLTYHLPVTTIFCLSHPLHSKLMWVFVSHLRPGLPRNLWNSVGYQSITLDIHGLFVILSTWPIHLRFDALILYLMSNPCVSSVVKQGYTNHLFLSFSLQYMTTNP